MTKTIKMIFIFSLLSFIIACNGRGIATNETESLTTNISETTESLTTNILETTNTQTTTEAPTSTENITDVTTSEPTTTTEVPTTDQSTTIPSTTEVSSTQEATTISYVTIYFENPPGATSTVTSMSGIVGNPFEMPDDPVKMFHVFEGWFLEDTFETPFNITEYPQNDMTVYAKWAKMTMITFDTNYDTSDVTLFALPGNTFYMPDDPIRPGYVFGGWFIDESLTIPFNISVYPDQDMTVYAKWTEEITVIDDLIQILENDFSFTCNNNVCVLQESFITYTFNLNNITFTKQLLDDDTTGDQQTKNEIVVIDENWNVEYNISITYLSTQNASMCVTGNANNGSYTVRSFSSNYLSGDGLYDDAVNFIDGDLGSGLVGVIEAALNNASLTMDDLK